MTVKRTTVWITGASGQLGSMLVQKLQNNVDYKVLGTDTDVDITDMEAVSSIGDIYHPNVIINCASISSSAECEADSIKAYKVNTIGARNLAIVSRKLNAKIIQLSTDDIFNGNPAGSVSEFDNPTPVNIYGKSKLAGENFVRELNSKHVIVRSSWVYGGNNDYLSFVLKNGAEGKSFEAAIDDISAPTSAEVLADFIITIMNSTEYGIFHATCEGMCSRNVYARTALSLAGYDPELAIPTVAEDIKGKSVKLDSLMVSLTGIYQMPDWKATLESHIKNRK